jgi:PadR family transcriptional regulator AphA
MQAMWPSEYILLALLCERPMHGYELAQIAQNDEPLRAIWRMERSEVYFLLGKLQRGGLIEETGQERGGGPRRVIYAPTPEGRDEAERWLRTPESYPRNLRTAMLVRVYLLLRRDPPAAAELIEAQRALLQAWVARDQQRDEEDEIVRLVRGLRRAQVEATIGALAELRSVAERRAAAESR